MKNNVILMEIDKPLYETIHSVQYDRNSRFVHVKLLNNSLPFDLTNKRVILSGSKPDGEEIFNTCKIEEGLVVIEITEEMNAIPGTSKYSLEIYGGDMSLLQTKNFKIRVTPSNRSKAIESRSEVKALNDLISEVQNIDNRFAKTNAKLTEVANKGTTVEVIERVTKEEIDRQIEDGTIANLTIEDNSITTEKYKNQSINKNKLTNELQEIISKTDFITDKCISKPEGSHTFHSINDLLTNIEINTAGISYTKNINSNNTVGGVYANTSTLSFNNFSSTCFVVVGFDDTHLYQMGLHNNLISIRKHIYTEYASVEILHQESLTSSIDSSGKNVKLIRGEDSVEIYVDSRLVATLTKAKSPYLFINNVFGFLYVGNGNADLNGYRNIISYEYELDVVRKSTFDEKIEGIETQMNSIIKEIGESYDYNQLSKEDVVIECQSCVSNSSMIAPSGLNTTYDWVSFVPQVKALKFRFIQEETFINLMTHKTKELALTLCLTQNLYGTIRWFSKNGRDEITRFNLPKISHNAMISIEFVDNGVYSFKVYDNNGLVIDEAKMDLTSYSAISDYKHNLGLLYFSATKGMKLVSDVVVVNENRTNLSSVKDRLNDISSDISKMKKDINNINDIIANGGGENSKIVDLIIFMGQSNMAGRGVASESPVVPIGQGYEFRAISDPTKLYPIVEPFGVKENNSSSGVSESSKTGSMVSSFVIEYYKATRTPVVAVSCSKGGTNINWWQPTGKPLTDAISRFHSAKSWLESNGYIIRHKYMVWCQGCSDGDSGTTYTQYQERMKKMIEAMVKEGIEKCFLVRIGNHRDNATIYDEIMRAQTDLCKEYEHAVLVSTKLCDFAYKGLMKDAYHYEQEGYNIVGRDAGINTAFYVNNNKEPFMYDGESTRCPEKFETLYVSKKN